MKILILFNENKLKYLDIEFINIPLLLNFYI